MLKLLRRMGKRKYKFDFGHGNILKSLREISLVKTRKQANGKGRGYNWCIIEAEKSYVYLNNEYVFNLKYCRQEAALHLPLSFSYPLRSHTINNF